MTENLKLLRQVQVVCPNCRGDRAECYECGVCKDLDAIVFATLADPEAEALMADGEQWRTLMTYRERRP